MQKSKCGTLKVTEEVIYIHNLLKVAKVATVQFNSALSDKSLKFTVDKLG